MAKLPPDSLGNGQRTGGGLCFASSFCGPAAQTDAAAGARAGGTPRTGDPGAPGRVGGPTDSRRKQATRMREEAQGAPDCQRGKLKEVDVCTSELASKCVWSFTQNLSRVNLTRLAFSVCAGIWG